MDSTTVIAFGIGILVGFLLAQWIHKLNFRPKYGTSEPDITPVCLSGGQLRIDGSANLPSGYTVLSLYSQIYDDPATVPPDNPSTAGAMTHGTTFPIERALPNGLSGRDLAVVWVKFEGIVKVKAEFGPCSDPGSGMTLVGGHRAPKGLADQPEAFPKHYQVSPATTGDATPIPGVVLQYSPDASYPAEPLWKAKGGAEGFLEWTLCLLHRTGGFGAVLSAIRRVGDRDERLTWVTSDWQFHATNRLAPESAEGYPIVVAPA